MLLIGKCFCCPEGEVKAIYSVTVWGLCSLTPVNTQDFMKGCLGG